MARTIAQAVAAEGGRTFFVGGFVRDRLMGRENKDIDLEIHGITPETLERILDQLGSRRTVGASFGVFGLAHYGLDISMPRKEDAEDRGGKGFASCVDPFIGTKKAALRRDFTINALMEDVLTGEVVDHFGGAEDLRRGVLRHVSDETFVQDPLRVLRGAQFAARFGFDIAEETARLCGSLDLSGLAGERIFEELKKALLKSQRPSVFFQQLRSMGQLSCWFPELEALIAVEQEPQFHPEGNVWNHTMLVLDQAAKLRGQAQEPVGFLLAALTHDFGKAVATSVIDNRIRAFGHEKEGVPLARRFLRRMTQDKKLIKYVLNMVELHMKPNMMAAQGSKRKATMKLFDRAVSPEDLLLLAKADHFGRTNAAPYQETERFLRQRLELFHQLMSRPYVTGGDLLEAGMEPGPDFKEALDFAHELRLAGVPKDSALRQTLSYIRAQQKQREKS